jgi:hypothetical protein
MVDALANRPKPPADIFEPEAKAFIPDAECAAWIRSTFIDPDGILYNDEHQHLQSATIGVLWTTVSLSRHMLTVAGQAEIPQFQGNGWSRGRQEQQMAEWFGDVPNFVLTFDAHYADQCEDATWCALVEHELYHCAQQRDEWGAPKFKKDGSPSFGMRGHDVEEFVGVVRRYGVGAAAGATRALVEAANKAPEIAPARIAACCGTCRLNF